MELRDEFTALGAWVVARLRQEFGPDELIRQDGKKEGDAPGRAIVYSITPLPDSRFARFSIAVRAIDAASSSWNLGPLAARIHRALHDRKNEALQGGWLLSSCRREGPLSVPPVVFKGVEHRSLGGSYRALVQ